jgi:hypothetical protein
MLVLDSFPLRITKREEYKIIIANILIIVCHIFKSLILS